jgi:hypothetical protein
MGSWTRKEAGAEIVCATNLEATLDRDWDQPTEREKALALVLNVWQVVETWVQTLPQEGAALVQPSLAVAEQVKQQDVEVNEYGKARLIKGVAKDRRISVEDAEMRHGRKSRSVSVDGDTRQVLHDLDTGLIRAVGITPVNAPEASVTVKISVDLERQGARLKELHIDRAYLSSQQVAWAQRRVGSLLQSLAGSRGKILSQAHVHLGLGTTGHSLSSFARNAFCARWHRPFSQRGLHAVSLANAMYDQSQRAKRQHPSR